jgi:hypothetical protein
MLPVQKKQHTSKKHSKWPLFLILMAISVFAYTTTSKSDKFDQTIDAVNHKHLQSSKNNQIDQEKLGPHAFEFITSQNDETFGKHGIFNNDQTVVGLLSKEEKEDAAQTFEFPEEGEQVGNHQPKNLHHSYPNNYGGAGSGQYIVSNGGTGGASGGSSGSGGKSENENNNDPKTEIQQTSAIPVPPAIWLLGSALLGFAGLRRRKNAN